MHEVAEQFHQCDPPHTAFEHDAPIFPESLAASCTVMYSNRAYSPHQIVIYIIYTIFGDLPISGDARFTLDDVAFVGFDGHYSDMKFVVSLSGNNLMDTTVIGKGTVPTVGDTPVKAGYFVTNANSEGIKTVIYYAYITFDNYSIYIENAGGESEREAVRSGTDGST